MDHLTPRKIQQLLTLAEDKTWTNRERRLLYDTEDLDRIVAEAVRRGPPPTPFCESSSGVYDLDQLPGFDEAIIMSSSMCNTFDTQEITGRSTDAETAEQQGFKMPEEKEYNLPNIEEIFKPKRDEFNIAHIADNNEKGDDFMNVLHNQSSQVEGLMRHSISVDMSFHSKRDLTADEISLIERTTGLKPGQNLSLAFPDMNTTTPAKDTSMGIYFGSRCVELSKVLPHMQSPDRSCMMPSITEVSQHQAYNQTIDDTLDSIPVRQSQKQNDTETAKSNLTQGAKLFKVPAQPVRDLKKSPAKKLASSKLPVCSKAGPSTNQKPSLTPPKPVAKPVDKQIKNLQALDRQDDTDDENSLSLSKIAEYIAKQSELSVSDILNLKKLQSPRSQPLSELDMNIRNYDQSAVTMLKDSHKAETSSSAETVETVLRMDKLQISSMPQVTVTEVKENEEVNIDDERSSKHATRSKSPSSRSQSTATTVKDNDFSTNSPLHNSQNNLGEGNRSKIPSPNLEYKELDKSVDWQEVLRQKRLTRQSVAKEKWADIIAPAVEGYVGVICAVKINVTTLTDSWLTASFQFDELPNEGKDLNVEIPRLPLLLAPGKSEQLTLYLTSNVEMNTAIPFTILLKDSQMDGDMPQKGSLKVNFKLPVIQAMSATGVNKVNFPPILEKRSHMKCFVLLNDCPADLQLELRLAEGESFFNIRNVQEVKKSEVNKALTEPSGGGKAKPTSKQLCRLTKGNAIKVTVAFNAPKGDSPRMEQDKVIKGMLDVHLFGSTAILRRVELTGVVGYTNLVIHTSEEIVQITSNTDATTVSVTNAGSLVGLWRVKIEDSLPFRTQPESFELPPNTSQSINLIYIGPEHVVKEGTIIFEEIATGKRTKLQVTGGVERRKNSYFPIKTNYSNMSWVCTGRKELSLMNCSDTKVQLRCKIFGDAFTFESPKSSLDTKLVMILTFGPQERRTLPIIFSPNTNKPYAAVLRLSYDKDSENCRKICLYGCESGGYLRWSGLATYGNTALVRAVINSPIELRLYNKSNSPAFVCANLHFNLHYLAVSSGSQVVGERAIVQPRAVHRLLVTVDWARVERRARSAPPATVASLATLSLLTGAEITRRRILRIIKDKNSGKINKSLLSANLKGLADKFEGEDPSIDNLLEDFEEPMACLEDVIDGLEELTAQIDLPQDFADENDTIVIADETVVHYHTLCE